LQTTTKLQATLPAGQIRVWIQRCGEAAACAEQAETTSRNKPSNKRRARVVNNQTPGTMSWPGAVREFQFP
jgi:hypothetical protein